MASRAVPIPAAMSDPGTQAAMADPGTLAAMADPGTPAAKYFAMFTLELHNYLLKTSCSLQLSVLPAGYCTMSESSNHLILVS